MAVQAFTRDFRGPTTTQGGAPSGGAAGVRRADIDETYVSPVLDPDSEDTVWLSEIPLPPIGTGRAVLKLSPAAKISAIGGAGKASPKMKKIQGEATKGSITVEWTDEAGPAMQAAIRTLRPGTGPYLIRHRKARDAAVEAVMIESWSDAPDWNGSIWRWSCNIVSVKLAAQRKGGGGPSVVKTPKASYVDVRPGNVVIGSNGNQVGGFGVGIGSNDNRVGGLHPDNDPGGAAAKKAAAKKGSTSP